MALNPNDPYYRAEVVPTSILVCGPPLRAAYGVGADSFGTKGNLTHTSGYHRSRDWVLFSPDSVHKGQDYSVTQPLDQGGDGRDVSAFDFTPGAWGTADNRAKMKVITARLYAAARANDVRLSTVREVAGTLDGTHVVTFYAQGGAMKSPFDTSHLDHAHVSFWRSRAGLDHSGLIEIMLGENMLDYSPATATAIAIGATDRGYVDEGENTVGWDSSLRDYNLRRLVLGSETDVPRNELNGYSLKAIVTRLGALETAVAGIEAAIQAGGTDPSVIRQAVTEALREFLPEVRLNTTP